VATPIRPRLLAIVVAVAACVVVACGGSSPKTVSAGGGSTTASTASATTTGGPDVSTNGSTTAPLSVACRAKGPALKPGAEDGLTIEVGGKARTFRRFVPRSLDPTKPAALVLNFHGLTSPIGGQVLISGFEDKAEQVGAIVVTPLGGGPGPSWNIGNRADLPDDVAFVSALIDRTERQACIDPRRVFAIGMSNGAQMSSTVGCRLSDRIAAIGTVAGLMVPKGCTPKRPMPVIAFHGTADQYLPFTGGLGPKAVPLLATLGTPAQVEQVKAELNLPPIPEVEADWARFDGCDRGPNETTISPHVTERAYDTACQGGSAVHLYVIAGGGHAWPGSKGSAQVESVVGKTTMEISANDLIWSFFEQHPLPA